ncbi:(d)CMP kinase [Tundrisphaera lichenicola]|uniref:(d)CMP kinase n=1 Tax=Tundrisphaera lichenicola TaxID=2029860 RepID=UPI003EB6D552
MQKPRVITIDGPAGAGKSTVARSLSDRLGWRLLDTGAMYRSIALAALRSKTNLNSDSALGDLVSRLELKMPPGRVLLNGEDVSSDIRGIEVTRLTRFVADSPSVRSRLVEWQRQFARDERQIVTEGRDQGTIVFPDAFRKYFLTASDEERARRRYAEFAARGEMISPEEVLRELRIRDSQDASRAIAPMRPADDASLIDCGGLDSDQVVAYIEKDIRQILESESAVSSHRVHSHKA